MPPTLYDTRTLGRVISAVAPPQPWVLKTFFPSEQTFDTAMVDFDLIKGGRKLAPFVSPAVAGRPLTHRGVVTNSFLPAYVKPKHAVELSRPLKRRAGEQYAGVLSAGERRGAIIADILAEQMAMIHRRCIWMAWQGLRTGAVIVKGEDYPETVVDFGRHPDLTKVLLAAARWGESGVSPLDDLEDWALEVADISLGAAPTVATMGTGAWKLFRKDPQVSELLESRRGSESTAETGPTPALGYVYKGTFGTLDIWVSTDAYEDDDGAVQRMVGEYDVVLASPMVEGVQCFGAVMDPEANYAPLKLFPKHWMEKDPAKEWLMTQSAPLMVPSRVDACACITVR